MCNSKNHASQLIQLANEKTHQIRIEIDTYSFSSQKPPYNYLSIILKSQTLSFDFFMSWRKKKTPTLLQSCLWRIMCIDPKNLTNSWILGANQKGDITTELYKSIRYSKQLILQKTLLKNIFIGFQQYQKD